MSTLHIAGIEPTYECRSCRQTGISERDLEERCEYYGSREEPAEFVALCPHCLSDRIEEEDIIWCTQCEDEVVYEIDATCMPCQVERAEAIMEDR